MADHMFGVTRRRLSSRDAERCNAICREHGGTGFVGPVNLPGSDTKGWFTCRNLGWTHDNAIASKVLAAVREAGIEL